MTGFDVIGDVHGNHDRLVALLALLGYQETGGAWRHPDRQAVFVGDLIDRRPDHQAATLRVVRSMVDAGSGQMVLGNHEFNAVAFATVNPGRWEYCRPHNKKNRGQHVDFIDELGFDTVLHREVIDWFRTIPLWLDLGGLRVVHACWSDVHLRYLEGRLTREHTLTDDVVIEGSTEGTETWAAIETVLKGPELDMEGAHFVDKGGEPRFEARARWWDPEATTLRRAAWIPDGSDLLGPNDERPWELADGPLADGQVPRCTSPIPVIFGHYWWTGPLQVFSATTACVDYSAGKGGPLVAYRWNDGDTSLDARQMVKSA